MGIETTLGFSTLEVKLGLRLIRKQPILAATAIVALALGIAVATTGFTLVDTVLHGRLPFEAGERFVRLEVFAQPEGHRTTLDLPRYHQFLDHADSFEFLGAMDRAELPVAHPSGLVDTVVTALVTPGSLRYLPDAPLLGRSLIPDDGLPGATPVVVLRDSYWQRRFEGDLNILGQTRDIAGVERTIVGVLPDSAGFPADGELWVPLDHQTLGGDADGARPGVRMFGVLHPGVGLEAADAEIQALSEQVLAVAPTAEPTRLALRSYVEPPEQAGLMGSVMTSMMVMLLIVIAANVANLILTRTAARSSEMAVRSALGASRGRLVAQLTVEMALLGALAAAVGLPVAHLAVGWLDRLLVELPFWITFAIGPRALAFTAGLIALVVVVGGTVPALKATSGITASRLQAIGRGGSKLGLGRVGAVMMVTEMALSVALLSAALVLAQGFSSYVERDFDLAEGEVLTARIYAPNTSEEATDAALAEPLNQRLVASLAELPGVVAVATSSQLPRADAGERRFAFEPLDSFDPLEPFEPLDTEVASAPADGVNAAEIAAGGNPFSAPMAEVSPGFFDALGSQASLGRVFADADLRPGALPVALVNEPFVAKYLGGRNPLGRRLQLVTEDTEALPVWHEIVGVVPDLGLSAADPARAGGVYLPLTGDPQLFHLALRAGGDPNVLAGPLRAAVASLDPEIELRHVQPLEAVNWDERAFLRGFSKALVAMGVMTLVLSLVGLYAMISFGVTRRTREIGIRVALGAGRRQVLAVIASGAMLYLGLGGLLGSGLASVVVRLQDAMLVTRLPSQEPWVVPTVLALLAIAGLVACWLPARRALGIEPTEALRYD